MTFDRLKFGNLTTFLFEPGYVLTFKIDFGLSYVIAEEISGPHSDMGGMSRGSQLELELG